MNGEHVALLIECGVIVAALFYFLTRKGPKGPRPA